MTVGELRNKLSKFPDNTSVVVYRELDNDQECFGIDGVDLVTGNSSRGSDGNMRVAFDRTGSATWCFIQISRE
jgi:hypothetical protein